MYGFGNYRYPTKPEFLIYPCEARGKKYFHTINIPHIQTQSLGSSPHPLSTFNTRKKAINIKYSPNGQNVSMDVNKKTPGRLS